jgi:hypothetical protein
MVRAIFFRPPLEAPQAREGAIALLDGRPSGDIFGEILETGS